MTGGTDDEQGDAVRGVGDVLDEVEEDWLGPVDVVKDHNERPAAGDGVKDVPHAPQQFIFTVTAGAGTHEGPDPQRGILAPFTCKRPELGLRLFFSVFEVDPGCLAEGFRDGPE